MEYFLLERPGWCWQALRTTTTTTSPPPVGTCGLQFTNGNHYSGIFWMASCRYVRQLTPLETPLLAHRNISSNPQNVPYLAAEFWVAGKAKRPPTDGQHQHQHQRYRHVSLLTKNYNHSLYTHLIVPSEYVIANETRAWELVQPGRLVRVDNLFRSLVPDDDDTTRS
mmetsp:Transcript_19552/g.53842  ORF Transcript_19552/g.53842 Transcript_19552/m.53842 type:complete len:167 (+) Transcript_19552:330-830(+)